MKSLNSFVPSEGMLEFGAVYLVKADNLET